MKIGTPVNGKHRYNYYISQNDFASMWVKMHADLGYPLMTDSRYKRAIVYNKQGLEKRIQDMIIEVIGNNLQELADIVADDITAQLDSLTQTTGGKLVNTRRTHSSNMTVLISKALSKGLVKGFNAILDDMTDIDRNRR